MNPGLIAFCCVLSAPVAESRVQVRPPDVVAGVWLAEASRSRRDAGGDFSAMASGVIGSWALAMPTFKLLYDHGPPVQTRGDAGYSPTANVGLLVAGAAGAAFGVLLARGLQDQDASIEGAMIGAAVATLPFLLGARDPNLPYYGLTLGTLAQTVGAWLMAGGS